MARKRAVKLIIAIGLLALPASIWANPTISYIAPVVIQGEASKIGQPLGVIVTFSESVHDFELNDIISNGQIIGLEGQNRQYRILVVPSQRILTMEILADSVKNIRGQGNEPLFGGPLIFDTQTNRILSNNHFASYAPIGTTQFSLPFFALPYNQVQVSAPQPAQPPPPPAPVVVQEKIEEPVPEPEPEEPRGTRIRFLFNAGFLAGGADFTNRDGQTNAKAQGAPELSLGVDTVTNIGGNSIVGLGFYTTIGYHTNSYTESGGSQAIGTYTAIPLELGGVFHIGNYMSIYAGILSHISPSYKHKGDFKFLGETSFNPREFEIKWKNPGIGGTLGLNFHYSKVGFTLKFSSINIGNDVTDSSRSLGLTELAQVNTLGGYQSLNFIQSVGFFVNFSS